VSSSWKVREGGRKERGEEEKLRPDIQIALPTAATNLEVSWPLD
jgi:hypothetical protein